MDDVPFGLLQMGQGLLRHGHWAKEVEVKSPHVELHRHLAQVRVGHAHPGVADQHVKSWNLDTLGRVDTYSEVGYQRPCMTSFVFWKEVLKQCS